jgi:osmotically-inducible protein OsmY
MIGQQQAPAPRLDAQVLRDRITHAIGRSWRAEPDDITVVVCGTKVRLTGAVRSQREVKMAAAVASVTRGVTEVENDLVVA